MAAAQLRLASTAAALAQLGLQVRCRLMQQPLQLPVQLSGSTFFQRQNGHTQRGSSAAMPLRRRSLLQALPRRSLLLVLPRQSLLRVLALRAQQHGPPPPPLVHLELQLPLRFQVPMQMKPSLTQSASLHRELSACVAFLSSLTPRRWLARGLLQVAAAT